MNSNRVFFGVRRFTKIQLLMIAMTLSLAAGPIRAQVWDAEVILQFLITKFNYIMEAVNHVGFGLEQYYERLGSMVEQNAQQQSTEVTAATIAEQTKMLGKTEIEMQFSGGSSSVNIGGRRYRISSISSTGCFGKKIGAAKREVARQSEIFKEESRIVTDHLINSQGSGPEQFAQIAQAVKSHFQNDTAHTSTNVINPDKSLNIGEATNTASVAGILANKIYVPEGKVTGNWMDSGEVSEDYYKRLTATIASVFNDNISRSVIAESSGVEYTSDSLSMRTQALANSYVRTKANNFKFEKGVKTEVVENAYRQILLKLENLNQLRQQEKLYSVIALKALNDMHHEIDRGSKP